MPEVAAGSLHAAAGIEKLPLGSWRLNPVA